jgi:hypothetical protein
MCRSPRRDDYIHCWSVLDAELGVVEADRVLMKAYREALRRRPYLVAIYLRNLTEFLVGFPPASTWLTGDGPRGTMTLFPHVPFDYRGHMPNQIDPSIPPRLVAELGHDFVPARYRPLRLALVDRYYGLAYTAVKFGLFVMVVFTMPFILSSRHRAFLGVCLAVVAYQALVVSVFAQAAFRYHVPVVLVELMLAGGGAWLARENWQRVTLAGPLGTGPREESSGVAA